MALQFCSGKTIPIKHAYEHPYVLTAENAGVAQTTVGTKYQSFMKYIENGNVIYVFITDMCACPTQFNICISFPSEAPEHTFKTFASCIYQTSIDKLLMNV